MKYLKFRPLKFFMVLRLTNNCRYYFISVFAGFTRRLLPFISHVRDIFVFLLGTLASRFLFFACFYTALFRPLCSTRARFRFRFLLLCTMYKIVLGALFVFHVMLFFYWVSHILFYPGVCFLPGSASSSILFFFPQLSIFFSCWVYLVSNLFYFPLQRCS